ncbi:MAG: IclR family transcriptional regulator [Anaerolineae bacterium]|nr:IclR family transcriptional regulator [Anaerolineae bacterium]
MTPKMGRDIQSLARGLDILTTLAESDRPMGVTEIAQALNVDKSTAFRLLSTLANRGFVAQEPDTRRYRPDLRIVELSRRVLDRIELRSIAKPPLKRLQRLTGESAHLAVLADGRAVYIDQEESNATLSVNAEIGRQAPAHCTAIGKSLIAYMSQEELSHFLGAEGLTRYTPRTITTLRELIPHLESVRERGYAVDDEEFDAGVRCLAAPIRDYRRKVIASIGISGPASRMTLDRMPELGVVVVKTAEEVSRLIGHREA